MSLKPLLDVDTKQEEWSALNCFSLNTKQIRADDIIGRLSSVSGVLVPGSVSVLVGTGTVSAVQSVASYWVSNASVNAFHTVSGAVTFDTDVTAPLTGLVSTFVYDLTLPFSASMSYPVAVGANIPGTASAVLRDGSDRYVASCQVVRKTATVVSIYCTVNADISAASAPRIIESSFSLQYQIVP